VNDPSRDYQRIEASLRRIERDVLDQPGLEELAAAAGMSAGHFQRVFTRWAGISPKRFLQAVTVESARARLEACRPVLDVAFDVGLSGSGRLHDLTLTCEAMTPGQIARRGQGLTIDHGTIASPFGPAFVAATPQGICAVSFDPTGDPLETLGSHWNGARLRDADEAQRALWQERLTRPLAEAAGPLALHIRGTNFQIQVWRALLRIPRGQVTDYGSVARGLGQPRAARAVGRAIGTNPIAVLIPCHRVLRRDGGWGGYRWGGARKVALLGRELGAGDQSSGRPD